MTAICHAKSKKLAGLAAPSFFVQNFQTLPCLPPSPSRSYHKLPFLHKQCTSSRTVLVQQLRDGVLFIRHCHLRRRPVIAVPCGRIGAMLKKNLHDFDVPLRGGSVQWSTVHPPGVIYNIRKLGCEVLHQLREPAQRGVVQRGGRGLLGAVGGH